MSEIDYQVRYFFFTISEVDTAPYILTYLAEEDFNPLWADQTSQEYMDLRDAVINAVSIILCILLEYSASAGNNFECRNRSKRTMSYAFWQLRKKNSFIDVQNDRERRFLRI